MKERRGACTQELAVTQTPPVSRRNKEPPLCREIGGGGEWCHGAAWPIAQADPHAQARILECSVDL